MLLLITERLPCRFRSKHFQHCEVTTAVWVVRQLVACSSQRVGESAHARFKAALLANAVLPIDFHFGDTNWILDKRKYPDLGKHLHSTNVNQVSSIQLAVKKFSFVLKFEIESLRAVRSIPSLQLESLQPLICTAMGEKEVVIVQLYCLQMHRSAAI